jgi:hypothetical protein
LADGLPANVALPPLEEAVLTLKASVAVWLSEPPAPVMVAVLFPVDAVPEALSVKVLVLAVVAGLKLAVTPLGKPLMDKATLLLNPPAGAIEMLEVALAPWASDTDAGVADKLKFATAGALTVKVNFVCEVNDPLFPVMVTVAVPMAAELPALNVSVVDPVLDVGLNDAVTPLCRPLAANDTAPANPPEGATVIVELPLPLCLIERLATLPDRLKPGEVLPGVSTTVVSE